MIKLGHMVALRNANNSIRKAHKEGRLVFKDVGVEYTDNQGNVTKGDMVKVAEKIYQNISDYLVRSTGDYRASLEALGVMPKDIEKILVEIKGK
jgi:hypothetical protein